MDTTLTSPGFDFRVQMAKDVGKTVADALAKIKGAAVLEPKWDGWRCIVVRDADRVRIFNPSRKDAGGKEYSGKLPELEADLMALPVGTILDGELVAVTFNAERNTYDNDFFRIHTCMRSNTTLAAQRKGITFVAFDIVQTPGYGVTVPSREIAKKTLPERRKAIQSLVHGVRNCDLTLQLPATQENHDGLVALGYEGSVVKATGCPYAFGKRGHGWFKIKQTTTIDCVVMEVVMDGKGQHLGKAGRMRVGQYVGDALMERCVVNCLDNAQRADATLHPERYEGQTIEVKVYGWHEDGTPRHPTPMRFRKDKAADECVWSEV
jgi:DNA ligase-1